MATNFLLALLCCLNLQRISSTTQYCGVFPLFLFFLSFLICGMLKSTFLFFFFFFIRHACQLSWELTSPLFSNGGIAFYKSIFPDLLRYTLQIAAVSQVGICYWDQVYQQAKHGDRQRCSSLEAFNLEYGRKIGWMTLHAPSRVITALLKCNFSLFPRNSTYYYVVYAFPT